MSKIIVLNGSPRKNGNTEKLVNAFVKGAQSAGHHVKVFSVTDTKVNACTGCDYCVKNDGECVQKDEMQDIYQALYDGDAVVFASPSYYYAWTAQLKAIVDRFYVSDTKSFQLSASAMLVPLAGNPETDAAIAVKHYEIISNQYQWEDKGVILVGNVAGKDDIVGNPALLEAEKLGAKM